MLLVAILLVTLSPVAFAASAQYANTRSFLGELDTYEIRYTLEGVDSDNNEIVHIKNKGDYYSYTIHYYFSEDNESVSIRIWNLIDFDSSDMDKVYLAVSQLNKTYKWVKFYADEIDNSVTLSADMIVRRNSGTGDIVLEMTLRIASILDDEGVYNALNRYDTN